MNDDHDVSRRRLLQAGAGTAVGGLLTTPTSADEGLPPVHHNIYEELGIETIINAAGTITTMGGSLMPPEVLAAWHAGSRHFVDLLKLQDRVGEEIARLLEVESALVTTGAAGGILVGTAASLTWKDPQRVGQLPLHPERGIEVIRQKSHRACYDHLVAACGVRLVDVETQAELEQAINEKTALMFSYNVHEQDGRIGRREWVEVARRRKIPTLLDAAADTPPLERLREYTQLGFDLVVFSGGKAIRGPQDTGLLLGRRELIEAAKRNTAPYCGNIGRGMKVSKEDMVAMWAAVKRFVQLDHQAEWQTWVDRIETISDAVRDLPTLTAKTIVPPIANAVPHLVLDWDPQQLKITPAQLGKRLAAGKPSIRTARVHGTGSEGFLVSVFMLQTGEDQIVAARIREALQADRG
ncbi:MAG: selenocysteine synthase [Planctomycetaceae bacterium]|nr:selenocysteine synthase [Planctomycetaceae bacterium]